MNNKNKLIFDFLFQYYIFKDQNHVLSKINYPIQCISSHYTQNIQVNFFFWAIL